MTDLFASQHFICRFGGGGIFILYPVLNVQLTPVVTANRHFFMLQYRVFPAVVSETLDSGGGIFILYPVLNVQLTPVVTANRHFHVTAFSLRCYPKHSIGMFCF